MGGMLRLRRAATAEEIAETILFLAAEVAARVRDA